MHSVLVPLQCDVPSINKGFQLGLFLLSFNLLPVTDGTNPGQKILEDKEMSCFYMDPEELDTGDVWQDWGYDFAVFQYHFTSHRCEREKKCYTTAVEPHKASK